MSDERRPAGPVWVTLLTVTLASYLPFASLLAYPMLLLGFGGPWIPGRVAGLIAGGLGLGRIPFLSHPFVWTVLTLALFTWLGRRGGRARVVATSWALVWAMFQSACLAFIWMNFHT